MADVYNLKIKKEYAAALIDDLIKLDAVEDLDAEKIELPQWQKEALDKELEAIAGNPNYTTHWDSVKNRFNSLDELYCYPYSGCYR